MLLITELAKPKTPLARMDEILISVFVINECHIEIPDSPNVKTSIRTLHEEVVRELLKPHGNEDLDKYEIRSEVNRQLRNRIETTANHAAQILSEKGCDALVPRAKDVLQSLL